MRRAVTKELTREKLVENLSYNKDTGEFYWIKQRPGINIGDRAGCLKSENGYWIIGFDNCIYYAHRLAWLYMTGEWPKEEVDHINLNRSDCRWANLRQATRGQNQCNKNILRNNTTGFVGVSFHKKTNKYRARHKRDGKEIYIGVYETPEEASVAYKKAIAYRGEFAIQDGRNL